MCGCEQVCMGVGGYGQGFSGVGRCWGVWAGVSGCGYAWVCACVWDEFSQFLLENRVLT